MKPGDDKRSYRGFDFEEDLPVDVTLNISQFLKGQLQFSLKVVVYSCRMVSIHIQAERAIQRSKTYKNLQAVFQLSMAPDFNKIWVSYS